jgi:hypothetical protein
MDTRASADGNEPPMRRIPDTEEEADEAADNGRNTGGKSYR